MSGEKQSEVQRQGTNPTGWEEVSNTPMNPELAKEEKSFTESELERIADVTGRVPDDPEVVKMNLVLRFQKFQQYQNLVENSQANHTMVQRGTLEDLATAKRDLEAAMYVYDDSFERADAKTADINEEEKRHNLKDQMRSDKHFGEGEATPSNSWVQARLKRKEVYDDERDQVAGRRAAAAERLFSELPHMAADMQQSEIYQTYELYKDQHPEGPIQDRRAGLIAGQKGLQPKDQDIDWAMYPHKDDSTAESTKNATQSNGNQEDEASSESDPSSTDNPDIGDKDNPDSKGDSDSNSDSEPESSKDSETDDQDDELSIGDRDKLEAEERAKMEAEERAKLEEEELQKQELEELQRRTEEAILAKEEEMDAEIQQKLREADEALLAQEEGMDAEIQQKLREADEALLAQEEGMDAEIQQKLREVEEALKYSGPLVAVNADFSHDKRELAEQYAERELNNELAHSGFIKNLWKGTLFRKYYQKKYEREIYEGERELSLGDEDTTDVDDVIDDRSGDVIKRFVLGVTEDYRYIHEKAGETLTEADAETSEAIKGAIEWFAEAEIPEGENMRHLNAEFGNRIMRIQAEARDRGQPVNDDMINNYFEVAKQARERVEHGIALERVMDGFKVYNAEARSNVRSEAHRDNLDKIIDRIESSKIGQVVPTEIVAAAVGTAWGLTQTGARAIAGPLAGIGVSAAISGLKERNQVTADRNRMMRDVAEGLKYGSAHDDEGNRGRAARKRAKYEAKIGGTLYDTRPANALTQNLEQALTQSAEEGGSNEALLQAIAEARVRVDYSDSESRDLISYSSGDKIGDERLALDIALIRAEKSLSGDDATRLEEMKQAVQRNIDQDVDEKDRAYRQVRNKQALKQAGKVAALGAAFFFGSQEAIAAIDPNKIGFFEKVGLLKTENSETASETILAGLAGPRTATETISNVSGDQQVEIQRYKDAGFEQVETKGAWTETKTDLVDVHPSASTHKLDVVYDGWANNGTTFSDGNELRAYLNNGQFSSGMSGNSTVGGQVLNYDQLAAEGRIKGYLTIGGAKFEVASSLGQNGELTWGDNGVFTTTTGETIKAIGDNGEELYQYFEIALDNGVDANGASHIVPFATAVGNDSFTGTIQQVTETIVEHPAIYDFIKETSRDVFMGGVAVPGVARRTSLGTASAPSTPEQPTPPTSPGTDTGATPTPGETSSQPTPTEQPSVETPSQADSAENQPESDSSQPGETQTEAVGDTDADAPVTAGDTPQSAQAEQLSGEDQPTPSPAPTTGRPSDNQPATQPPANSTDPSSQPTSEDNSPEPDAGAESAPSNPFRDQVNTLLGSRIGEEGVDILSSNDNKIDIESSTRFAEFWNSLSSDEDKNAVIDFVKNSTSSEYGRAFRTWLQNQGLIPLGDGNE